jgi:hypothetical protein
MEPSPCVVNGYMMRSSTSAFRQTRARAVVDALEREMDPWFESLNQRFDIFEARLERKLDDFELRMTVKLGSMMILGFGLVITALRVWG